MLRTLAAALTVTLALTSTFMAADARATCMRIVNQKVTITTGTRPVPRNTRVELGWTADVFPRLEPASVQLRTSGTPSLAVKTTMTTVIDSRGTRVMLTPDAPLDAKQRYEIVDASEDKPRVLGFITTNDTLDTQAPIWNGKIEKAETIEPVMDVVVGRTGGCGEPWIGASLQIFLAEDPTLHDDVTPRASVSFAIWRGDKKSFDPRSAPAIIVPATRVLILESSAFALPDAVLGASGRLPLVIAPIDLAGNVGTPAFVVAHGKTKLRR